MKTYYFLIIIFLTACTSSNSNKMNTNFNFPENMTFDEFKIKLEEYSKYSPYPNIDEINE